MEPFISVAILVRQYCKNLVVIHPLLIAILKSLVLWLEDRIEWPTTFEPDLAQIYATLSFSLKTSCSQGSLS